MVSAAVMLECVVAIRAKRVHEQALLRLVALEVIRGPEIACRDRMALDQSIVLGDARFLEPSALGEEFLDVVLDVEVLLLLKLCKRRWKFEQFVVERWPRCGESEPVATHPGKRRASERNDGVVSRRLRLHAVRVDAYDPIPVGLGPAKVIQIEGNNGLVRIDCSKLQYVQTRCSGC
jgi:hypothetical protein